MTDAATSTARREAAQWVARRADGLDPARDAAFRRWLAADPRHSAAWIEADAAWAAVNQPRRDGEAARLRARIGAQREGRRRRTRQIVFSAGLAAAAAVVIAFFLPPRNRPASSPAAITASVVIRPHVQTLADGSRVELNAGAEIAVDFTPELRAVRLVRGEALFTVAKNPARPFVVTAGDVQVRAVGTEFSVRLAPSGVDVLVTEGRVAVNPAAATASLTSDPAAATAPSHAVPLVFVDAGAQARVHASDPAASASAPAVTPVTPAAIAAALAWRERRVEFAETPLGDTLAWFNRQNALQLSLATPALASRRINGVFWTDDPEGFARLLSATLGLRAERSGGNTITLHAR